jgi:glycosyltransferase involved in cell wall biosynthesis
MDKILVISDFPDAQYKKDAGTPALRMIMEALSKKYEVHLISPSTENEGYPMVARQHHVPANTGRGILSRKLYPFRFYMRAVDFSSEILMEEDIKLIYGAGCLSTLVAGYLTDSTGIPSIGRLFGTYLFPHLNNPVRLLTKYEEKWAFTKSGCTEYVITNDGTKGDVVARQFGIPDDRVHFWTNGVEVPQGSSPHNDEKVRIISMARLDKWKRVDRIITAFLSIAADNKNVNLDIIGDGPERENLQRIAFKSHHLSKQIHFFGEVPRKKALEMLADSDIFITTNDYSNVSNSLLEAMAAGKCVVALDTGATSDFVEDGISGLLAPNEEAIEKDLRYAIHNKSARERFGKDAKDYIRHNFTSWDERIAKEVDLCARLISP